MQLKELIKKRFCAVKEAYKDKGFSAVSLRRTSRANSVSLSLRSLSYLVVLYVVSYRVLLSYYSLKLRRKTGGRRRAEGVLGFLLRSLSFCSVFRFSLCDYPPSPGGMSLFRFASVLFSPVSDFFNFFNIDLSAAAVIPML